MTYYRHFILHICYIFVDYLLFCYPNLIFYREFEAINNAIEIGITPAAGLQPPTASIAECFIEQQKPKTAPVTKGRMLTTRQLASVESRSVTKEVSIP